jgi:hypothetical protein
MCSVRQSTRPLKLSVSAFNDAAKFSTFKVKMYKVTNGFASHLFRKSKFASAR